MHTIEGDYKSYVMNCYIEARNDEPAVFGDATPAMFVSTRHYGVQARLDGYAIVPIERYQELCRRVGDPVPEIRKDRLPSRIMIG